MRLLLLHVADTPLPLMSALRRCCRDSCHLRHDYADGICYDIEEALRRRDGDADSH